MLLFGYNQQLFKSNYQYFENVITINKINCTGLSATDRKIISAIIAATHLVISLYISKHHISSSP